MTSEIALAIDPGMRKCGIAVVERNQPHRTLHREVTPTQDFTSTFRRVLGSFPVTMILVGDATHAQAIRAEINRDMENSLPLHFVPEAYTSEKAKARWCTENPPRSLWERILPGFRTPTEPVDDYAAVILAERYFDEIAPIT